MRERETQTGGTCLCYFTVTARATLQTYLCASFYKSSPKISSELACLTLARASPPIYALCASHALSPSPESSLPSASPWWLSTPEVHTGSIQAAFPHLNHIE